MALKLQNLKHLMRYNSLLRTERLTVCSNISHLQVLPYTQKRNYKNFGHKPEPESKFTKIYCTILTLGVIIPVLNFEWFSEKIKKFLPKVDAFSGGLKDETHIENLSEVEEDDDKKKKQKKKVGFRDRKGTA